MEHCCTCNKEMPYDEWIKDPFCNKKCSDEFWDSETLRARETSIDPAYRYTNWWEQVTKDDI